MNLRISLAFIIGLAFAVNSYADHRHSNSEFEARYQYSNGKGHDRHAYKHHHDVYYVRDDHHDYHDRYHDRYYVRHVHSRHCGHHYEPAFNTRVKVFLGI